MAVSTCVIMVSSVSACGTKKGITPRQMLSHFEPAVLKIDRSFIIDLAKSAEHQKKVREFVTEAHRLEKQTIAEFVSDASSMTVLFSIGVDLVQGNFLAPPGPTMNYEFD